MNSDIQERLDDFIRLKGLRRTVQRERIVEVVFSRDEHFTAEELFDRVRKVDKDTSRATVYRTLGLLVEADLLRQIDLGENQVTYDPNFHDKPSHNHLVCADCGHVEEFEDGNVDIQTDCLTRRLGFKPLRQSIKIEASCEELRLKGRCHNMITSRLSGRRLRKKTLRMAVLKPRFEVAAADAPEDFQQALGGWFSEKGKDYPWRRTREPYPVLVSEMMLQQTRLATVLGKGYYTRFLEKFPDVRSLAEADDESLLKAWEGLGYYRRARMLRETGRAVLRDHGGEFPSDEVGLLALPGIGPYTAAALLSFAFGKVSALVDGNVSRVLARLTDDFSLIDSTATVKEHRKLAAALCDPADPRRHHYAMMELGQTVCSVGVPRCESCPVTRFCKSSSPELLPMKKPRVKITQIAEYALWVRDARRSRAASP